MSHGVDAQHLALLEARLGRDFVLRRLQIEARRKVPAVPTRHVLHPANWFSKNGLIRAGLTVSGLHARGRRNALDIRLRHHTAALRRLPAAFDGYLLLQLSDLHLDMDREFQQRLMDSVRGLHFDACLLTGDFRFRSYGPHQGTLDALALLRPLLGPSVFAVLGNHDTVQLVPGMEAMDIRVLMNESAQLAHGGATLALAGVDDPHYYRTHDIGRAAAGIAKDGCAILLAHAPEPYREAAEAGFDLMLSGHTHGGQVCLPGGLPMLTGSRAPRAYARGAWNYRGMAGYTSVGCGASIIDVRLNCLPEITLHRLQRGAGAP